MVKDPYNRKIQNLTVKSRDIWFKKLQEYCMDNSRKCDAFFNEPDCIQICIDIESDVFQQAKNLIIYQSNMMKKIKDIKGFTSGKKSYMIDFNSKHPNIDEKTVQHEENASNPGCPKTLSMTNGFTSATNVMLMRNEQAERIQQKLFEDNFFTSNSASLSLDDSMAKHEVIVLNDDDDEKDKKPDLNETNSVIMIDEDVDDQKSRANKDHAQADSAHLTIDDSLMEDAYSSDSQMHSRLYKKTSSSKAKPLSLQSVSHIVVNQLTAYYKNERFLDKVGLSKNKFGITGLDLATTKY